MWPFKTKKRHTPKDLQEKEREPRAGFETRNVPVRPRPFVTESDLVRRKVSEPSPAPSSGNDFLTGYVVAEALSGGCPEAGLVGGAIGGVTGGIIGAEIAPCHNDTPSFGGGDFSGAGAGGDYSAPSSCDSGSSSIDTSSSSSFDSSSSSCFDSSSSSSFDSGSSSSFDSGSSSSGSSDF